MTATPLARSYRLTRPGGLGFFRRRSAAQFAICCAGVGLELLAFVLSSIGIGGRVALALCGLAVVGLGAGRSFAGEDFVSLIGPLARFSTRRVAGRNQWSAAVARFDGAALPPLFAGITLFDLENELPRSQGLGRFGLVADRADASVSCVLRVRGEGFLLADDAEKDARLAAFGEALASLVRDGSPVTRVSWSHLVGPAPLSGHLSYLAATRRAEPDEAIASSYGALLDEAAETAVASEVLVTLTAGVGKVKTSGRSDTSRLFGAADRLFEDAELFSTELSRAGLIVVGPLSAGAIARALRDRLDPAARQRLDRRGRSLGELCGFVTPENGFPLSIEERRLMIRTDESFHRVFRVAEWPRLAVRADWLAGYLCDQGVTRSLTVIYTPLDRRLAHRQALQTATRVGASIDERELRGRRVGAEERRAHLAAEALDEELESGAQMELVVGLVDVVASSEDELDLACERSCQSAANVGIELRPIAFRQGEALLGALPLGRVVPGGAR